MLKKLPVVLVGGTLIPLFVSAGIRLSQWLGMTTPPDQHATSVDILSIATVITVWMGVFTVAIGCFVVMLMKGPAYVADAYQLKDSEKPLDEQIQKHH